MSFEILEGREVTPQTSFSNPLTQIGAALARLFGCWHKDMSKPFGRDGKSYRDCLKCGARRDLDQDWRMVGRPYYTGAKH
jgi:hypothetical protein